MSNDNEIDRAMPNVPPGVSIPKPPASFVPYPKTDKLGWRPLQSALAVVPAAVAEVTACPSWSAKFGVAAPPSTLVGARLQSALAWTALLDETRTWMLYVASQEGVAWKEALEVLGDLKVPFQLAAGVDATVAASFPALAKLLDAQAGVARRSAATKRKRRSGKEAKPGASVETGSGEPVPPSHRPT